MLAAAALTGQMPLPGAAAAPSPSDGHCSSVICATAFTIGAMDDQTVPQCWGVAHVLAPQLL